MLMVVVIKMLMCLGDKDVDGGGGDVHPGLAASSALQCAGQDVPRYQLVS